MHLLHFSQWGNNSVTSCVIVLQSLVTSLLPLTLMSITPIHQSISPDQDPRPEAGHEINDYHGYQYFGDLVTSPWVYSRLVLINPILQHLGWFIDWFIHSSVWTVPRVKYSSLWAKILKMFSNIDLMEVHHISKIGVCIYLSCLTNKEIMVNNGQNLVHGFKYSPGSEEKS